MIRCPNPLNPLTRSVLCGAIALGSLFASAQPAIADAPPPANRQVAAAKALAQPELLESEALRDERQGRWLGAIAAWRGYARNADASSADWRKAMGRLHELSGLSWAAPIKAREVLPPLVGKEVVVVPYRVKYGDGLRDVVVGIDIGSGSILWTREDAVAFRYQGDVMVFVHNWQHVVRLNLKSGGDMWEHAFPPPAGNVVGPRNQIRDDRLGDGPRKVLGLHGDSVIVQGDTWPMALDVNSGKVVWGPNAEARRGYRARLTDAGVVAWPGEQKPRDVDEAQWQGSPMVMLSFKDGAILWKRKLIPGEPWYIVPSADRLYVSDPHLQTEVGWTALSLEKGVTVWRQPLGESRPSLLVPSRKVLVVESPDGLRDHVTRFLDPETGRILWQSDRIVKITQQGLAFEESLNGPLQARDMVSGRALWSLPQGADLHVDVLGALIGNNVYLPAHGPGAMSGADTPGALMANRMTGDIEWRHRAADTPYRQDLHNVALAGNLLLMEQTMQINKPRLTDRTPPNTVSTLLAFDAMHGTVAWGFYDLQPVASAPPVRVSNALYVVGQDRDSFSVYSFDLARIDQLVKLGRRWWW